MKTELSVISQLSEQAREDAILKFGMAMVSAHGHYEVTGCPVARARAEDYRISMESLIKQRSPEQVTAMEKARGLVR